MVAKEASDLQRRHYAETARTYDSRVGNEPEHDLALYILLGLADSINAESLLDVGAGTGRGLKFLMGHRPNMKLRGIEPVAELRHVAVSNGIPAAWIQEGNGYKLPFPDASFDLVSEFGVLHHVKKPEVLVHEMLRVARYGIFISDTNNFGQGGLLGRLLKNVCYRAGLWKALTTLRTKGRGHVYEPNDGLWYYYSLFSHFPELKRVCHSVHVMNTRGTSSTPWFSASHAAIFATKAGIEERSYFYKHLR